MPVSNVEPIIKYTGNGVATVFAYPYKVLTDTDITIYVNNVEQIGGYSVAGVGNDNGGNVTFSTAPGSGALIVIQRIVTFERDTDYQPAGAFREDQVDRDQDLQTMQIQQLASELGGYDEGNGRFLRLVNGDQNGSGRYDAQDNRIIELSNPVSGQDAVNLQTMSTAIANASAMNASVIKLVNYNALRNYAGTETNFYITGVIVAQEPDGISGSFMYDPTDTTTPDNGGTVIVGLGGKRYKRDYKGGVYLEWFEGLGDGSFNNSPIFNAIIASGIRFVTLARGKTYALNSEVIIPYGVDSFTVAGEVDTMFNSSTTYNSKIKKNFSTAGTGAFRVRGKSAEMYGFMIQGLGSATNTADHGIVSVQDIRTDIWCRELGGDGVKLYNTWLEPTVGNDSNCNKSKVDLRCANLGGNGVTIDVDGSVGGGQTNTNALQINVWQAFQVVGWAIYNARGFGNCLNAHYTEGNLGTGAIYNNSTDNYCVIDYCEATAQGVRFEANSARSKAVVRGLSSVATKFTDLGIANTYQDDIIESFTPTISGATSAGTATYSLATGKFVRVGRMVRFTITLVYSAFNGTGQLRVNLPLVADASVGSQICQYRINAGSQTFTGQLFGNIPSGAAYIQLQQCVSGTGVIDLPVSANGNLVITGEYIIR
jgi:hypothetical protein